MMQAQPERDTRIDVLRALALLTIYIDHVPGTLFEHLTYKNFGFSDAAEGFVLISGISVALAYGTKFEPSSRLLTMLKMWRRAGVLYASHIVTTLIALAIFAAAAVFAKRPDLLQQINIQPVIDKTAEAMVGIVTLGHQIGYNNILSVYAVLLLASPAFLLLANFRPWMALAASGALWLAAGLFQIALPNYPEPGFWFINPLSWQFLFNIGMIGMLHVRRGGSIPVNRWLVGAAACFVVASLVWVHSPLWGRETWLGLPAVLTGFDKTFLSVSRLLHILSVAYLIIAIPAVSKLARRKPDHPLAILGKRSLPVFISGTIIAMVAQAMKAVNPGGISYDALLIVTGVIMQFALAYFLEWQSGLGSSAKKATVRSAPHYEPRMLPSPAGMAS